MTVRDDLEKTLDPERFGQPDLARSMGSTGRPVSGESGEPAPDSGIEEVLATLGDYVVAFRTALLQLADEVERLKH